MDNFKIYLLMIMATVFWAGAFVAGKIGISEMSPVQLTFYRFFFSSIIIFVIMIKKEKNWLIKKEDIPMIIIMGIIGMVGYHVLFFEALDYTSVGNASIIAAANPIITMLLASFFLDEALSLKRLAVFLVAFIGVLLTLTSWDLTVIKTLDFNKGELIMLCATSCWAVYSIMVRKMVKKYTPLVLTTYCFLICMVVMFPFTLREGLVPNVSYKTWLLCVYMGVFASVIGYLVQQMAIKQLGPSKTNLFINLVPFFSIVLSFVILGEKTTLLNIVSGAIIVIAVYLNFKISISTNLSEKHLEN